MKIKLVSKHVCISPQSGPKHICFSQQLHQTGIWTKTHLVYPKTWPVAYLDWKTSGLVHNLLGNFFGLKNVWFVFFFGVCIFLKQMKEASRENNKRIKGFWCKQWLMLMEFVRNKLFLGIFLTETYQKPQQKPILKEKIK